LYHVCTVLAGVGVRFSFEMPFLEKRVIHIFEHFINIGLSGLLSDNSRVNLKMPRMIFNAVNSEFIIV
jgi:hypothetical protein